MDCLLLHFNPFLACPHWYPLPLPFFPLSAPTTCMSSVLVPSSRWVSCLLFHNFSVLASAQEFSLYDSSRPCLPLLTGRGQRLAAESNQWEVLSEEEASLPTHPHFPLLNIHSLLSVTVHICVIFNASAFYSNNILCLAIFFCGCLDSQLLPTIKILSVVTSILYSKQGRDTSVFLLFLDSRLTGLEENYIRSQKK